jgi:excisionase family DNA binding protein
LFTIAEAAEYLNVPYTWLRDKVTERQVPFTRLGKHVRFTEQHLGQIVAAGEQPVAPRPVRGRRRRCRR